MRPNILFIMADQFRADAIGRVGGYARTPNLDKLAGQGCLFLNAFANSAECIPSRISLATGLYPHQSGVQTNVRCTLSPTFPNWMQSLEAVGYQTSLFGKTHLHPHEGDLRDRLLLMNRFGLQVVDETTGPRASANVRSNMTDFWEAHGAWDAFRDDYRRRFAEKPFIATPSTLPLNLYYDHYVGEAARRHIASISSQKPWFGWVSFGGPHEPWDAPEPYASMYGRHDMPLPRARTFGDDSVGSLLNARFSSPDASPPNLSPEDIADLRSNYAGNVTLIDNEIGEILSAVEARGESENTLVVFTSDHGELNGDYGLIYKGSFVDPAIKIPLIIVPPSRARHIATGHESSALVELIDVGATILDFATAEMTQPSRARSLRPVIDGSQRTHRSVAVSEFADHTCVIAELLKVEFDAAQRPVLAFDRVNDPEEGTNVVANPRYQQLISEAKQWLQRFLQETPRETDVVLTATEELIETLATVRGSNRFELWEILLKRVEATRVLELGVWKGDFAAHVLKTVPQLECYYMLDPWRPLEDWNKPANVDQASFDVIFAEAMSKTNFASEKREVLRGTTLEVIDSIPDGSLDAIYIDGDHTLRGISIDLIRAYPKIRAGGIIGGDDYTPSVWQHEETFEPTLVCPFAAYFAESQQAPLIVLDHDQFVIVKPTEPGRHFKLVETVPGYGARSLLWQVQKPR